MAKKEPANPFQDYLKMFDPANLSKAFDPTTMMEKFGANASMFDPQKTIEKSKSHFDAMAKANEAAAKSYRDLMEKQMKIFQDLTTEAVARANADPKQDAAAVYQESVKRALQIMTELSDAARDANNQAYDAVRKQVDEAMKDLKS